MKSNKSEYHPLDVLVFNDAKRQFETKSMKLQLVPDIEHLCALGKLYITKPNKQKVAKYVIECGGLRWFDAKAHADHIFLALSMIDTYINTIRNGFYVTEGKCPKNIELTKLLNDEFKETNEGGEVTDN